VARYGRVIEPTEGKGDCGLHAARQSANQDLPWTRLHPTDMRQMLHDFLMDDDRSWVLTSQWTEMDFRREAAYVCQPGNWLESFHVHVLACVFAADVALVPDVPGEQINFFSGAVTDQVRPVLRVRGLKPDARQSGYRSPAQLTQMLGSTTESPGGYDGSRLLVVGHIKVPGREHFVGTRSLTERPSVPHDPPQRRRVTRAWTKSTNSGEQTRRRPEFSRKLRLVRYLS
jgi:hypothetical protein